MKGIPLERIQEVYRNNLQNDYQQALDNMYRLNNHLTALNAEGRSYSQTKDSLGRTCHWKTTDNTRHRVKSSDYAKFQETLRATSKQFEDSLDLTHKLHFKCRDHNIPTPFTTFIFLERWKKVNSPKKQQTR